MKQKIITFVSATFGSLYVVAKENSNYPNTFEIGNKRIDFSEILDSNINLHDCENYDIIIWDGIQARVDIIVGPVTYTGTINIRCAPTEELLAFYR